MLLSSGLTCSEQLYLAHFTQWYPDLLQNLHTSSTSLGSAPMLHEQGGDSWF